MKPQSSPDTFHANPTRRHPAAHPGLALLSAAMFAPAALAGTLSWSGGGTTANWSESANWGYAGVPVNGDTLIFPAAQPRLINTNNISSLSLSQIRFVGAGGGYAIWGNSFTIGSGGIEATNTAGANTINNAITLGASPVPVNVGSGVSLTLAGVLSGSGGLTKNGPGTLTFSGANGNQYGGVTTVNEGQLDLNKAPDVGAFSWAGLVIGDGIGTDTVRCRQARQIWADGKPVTIKSSGVLDLNGFIDTAIPLTMDGGQITTGAGSIWLADTVSVLPEAATATISGNAYLYRAVVFTNAGHAGTYDLIINAAISGAYGITKTGAGAVRLNASNAFNGPVTINQGTLSCWNADALGTTNSLVTVNSGGTLHLAGNLAIGIKPLVLNGPGWDGALFVGALAASDGISSWAGVITNLTDSTVYVFSTRSLELSGPISGPGGLTKTGGGTNIFSGPTANTYAGTTRVNAGTLVLNKSASVISVPGDLVVGDGSGTDVVKVESGYQTANSADVLVQAGGLLDCQVSGTWIDTLHGTGTVNIGDGGWLRVGVNGGTSVFDGPITGIGYAAGYTLGKSGSGTFTLNGNASFSAGITHLYGGKLVANGSISSAVAVESVATLGGTGTVGALTANGTISPGASPGKLTCGDVTFGASGSLAIELNGNTVGSAYDQLNVVGTVNLTGAALPPVTVGFLPTEGDQFIIVNNDLSDAVTGTFNGLAEGAVVSDATGKFSFRVRYAGGSGNDVTLTVTNVVLKPGAALVSSGNGNHAIEVNECNLLSLVVSNLGATAMTGASATLRSLTPGVAVVQPFSSYPDLPAGQCGTNFTPFQVSTLPGFVCGANVNLELSVASTTYGTLKVPFILGSGVPASPVRFDVNTSTNIPDIGTIESTNVVAGFSGPLLKVAVSLWLTHIWDADLNLSLISPAGAVVDLSSGNGNGGNFGSGCSPDANRTTFDDDAPTAITAGVPPYVGSFRPEGSLASLIGGAANGNWRLRVQDTTGGTLGAVRCWSLFLYGVDCTPAGGPCELCPEVTIFSATGPTSFTQFGFVNYNGIASTCAAPKACPGTASGGTFPSDNYVFRNGPSAACVTVTLENPSSTRMLVAAYTNSFNPADPDKCLNYLADAGTIVGVNYPTTTSFSFSLAPAAVFVVNVIAEFPGSIAPYKLTVSGGNCRPVLAMTPTGPAEAKFDWSTAAAGYHLEHGGPLGVAAAWPTVSQEPIVVSGRFTVTNALPPTNCFFRLHKPPP